MNLEVNTTKIMAIAKKEYMDNVRNRWILLLTILFAILTMVFSYFGGAQTGGDVEFHGFEATVVMMMSITSILLPIIAIMLGYATVVGEEENGSMAVVLGCPVSRFDVVIGKFTGLGMVLFTTIFAGMGLSGLIIAALASADQWEAYIAFMIGTWIFTMVFLGFSIFMSTLARKKTTAMGGGVFLWFSGMILGVILLGVWTATGGDLNALIAGDMSYPDWVWAVMHLSFMDTYQMGSMLIFDMTSVMGFEMDTPDWITTGGTFAWLTFMAALSFVLSLLFFQKKDI